MKAPMRQLTIVTKNANYRVVPYIPHSAKDPVQLCLEFFKYPLRRRHILGKKKTTRGRITHTRNESVVHRRRVSQAMMLPGAGEDSW